jgi:cystathionine gamma-synthase
VRRGIVTYAVRQERAAANAARLAGWLSRNPFVARVNYPGLASHPDHERAKAALRRGFGSLLSFELDVNRFQAEAFLRGLNLIRLVHSLGGPSTTLSHAPTMTHRSVTAEHRARIGLHEGFFRLSAGLEDATDLERELAHGLAAVQSAKGG